MFDYTKLHAAKKTKIVDLGGQKVTVIELPMYTLLKFKKLRTLLASSIARFTQRFPLGGQELKTEKTPLVSMDGKDTAAEVTVQTDSIDTPEVSLIDKTIDVRQQAISDAAEVLLDDEFFHDILTTAVKEFKDEDKDKLMGPEGLTIRQVMLLAEAIITVNGEGLDKLGNSLSLLTGKKKKA